MNGFKEILQNVDLWVALLWVALIVTLVVAALKAIPVLRKFTAFLSDVAGEDARPGRDRVPGLFERLANMEQAQVKTKETQDEILTKVNIIHHEVFPNSGKSLRDQTDRIEEKVSADYKEISALNDKVSKVESQISSVEESVSAVNDKLDQHLGTQTDMLKILTEEES